MHMSASTRGFTLIEMIVSLGVFAIVVTITTGALLTLVYSNQRYQNEQNVMTNLSFALDSMTREMRMGTNYYCASAGSASGGIFGDPTDHEDLETDVRDCQNGRGSNDVHGVSFIEGGDSITGPTVNRILYFYDEGEKKLYRRVGDADPQPITSENIIIDHADFFVTDTEQLITDGGNDKLQPTITIQVVARDSAGTASSSVQTTVTQRALDI